MKITNASTVHQIWGNLPDANLIAVFADFYDAKMFCAASIAKQSEEVTLACVDGITGEMLLYRRSKTEAL